MDQQNPKEWEAYNKYCIWLSLPKHYWKIQESELADKGFDEELIKLCKLKNKKAFCEEFCISNQRLSEWDDLPETQNKLKANYKKWGKRLTPNVVGKLYEKIMEEGDAGRIKLWKEMIEEEVEKVNVDIGYNRILENMKLDGEIDNGKK